MIPLESFPFYSEEYRNDFLEEVRFSTVQVATQQRSGALGASATSSDKATHQCCDPISVVGT